MGAMMGAGIISGIGSIFSGIAGKEAADYQSQVAANNAQIARENAVRDVQAADVQATNQGLKTRGQLGTIKAQGNGIDINSGSAAKVQQSANELGMLDALTIRNRGQAAAWSDKAKASSEEAMAGLYKMQGSNALTSSLIGGASSLAGGYAKQQMYGNNAPKVASDWSDVTSIIG